LFSHLLKVCFREGFANVTSLVAAMNHITLLCLLVNNAKAPVGNSFLEKIDPRIKIGKFVNQLCDDNTVLQDFHMHEISVWKLKDNLVDEPSSLLEAVHKMNLNRETGKEDNNKATFFSCQSGSGRYSMNVQWVDMWMSLSSYRPAQAEYHPVC
jgi:hypothetical protein